MLLSFISHKQINIVDMKKNINKNNRNLEFSVKSFIYIYMYIKIIFDLEFLLGINHLLYIFHRSLFVQHLNHCY